MVEIIAIITLVLALYWRTFSFGVIVDDEKMYEGVKKGKFGKFKFTFTHIAERLYGAGTLARYRTTKDGLKWKVSAKEDHILATALHALVCCLIYLAFGKNQVSLFAAILYACNPINNQTAIWLNGRRYQMNIIIVLCMVMMGKWGLALYPLTAAFQVSAFFAPIIYGPIGLLMLPVVYLLSKKYIDGKIKHRASLIYSKQVLEFYPKKLVLITKIFGIYFQKMLFPGRTLISYPDIYYFGMTEEGNEDAHAFNWSFVRGVGALAITIAGFFLLHGNLRWWWAFMALATLQWSGIIAVTQLIADRYVSLANVFMMFFVSYLAHTFLGVYTTTVLLALAVYYAVNLNVTMKMYPSIYDCYDYNIYFNRKGVRCREHKAARLLVMKDAMGAWEVIKEGLILNPNDMKMNMLAAHCCMMMEDRKAVLTYLNRAKQNCYIGQEPMFKSFQRMFFGIDIDDEVAKIANKESKLERKHREEVLKIYDVINDPNLVEA